MGAFEPRGFFLQPSTGDLLQTTRSDERKRPLPWSASVAALFDEIVVVDTGSTDPTREIAREFGARVFDSIWVDDFTAARNVALA